MGGRPRALTSNRSIDTRLNVISASAATVSEVPPSKTAPWPFLRSSVQREAAGADPTDPVAPTPTPTPSVMTNTKTAATSATKAGVIIVDTWRNDSLITSTLFAAAAVSDAVVWSARCPPAHHSLQISRSANASSSAISSRFSRWSSRLSVRS